jgi:hypothetical protein
VRGFGGPGLLDWLSALRWLWLMPLVYGLGGANPVLHTLSHTRKELPFTPIHLTYKFRPGLSTRCLSPLLSESTCSKGTCLLQPQPWPWVGSGLQPATTALEWDRPRLGGLDGGPFKHYTTCSKVLRWVGDHLFLSRLACAWGELPRGAYTLGVG